MGRHYFSLSSYAVCVSPSGIRLVLVSCDSHVTHGHLARLFLQQLLKVRLLSVVCAYVCTVLCIMYVRMYVCMYVCMYV